MSWLIHWIEAILHPVRFGPDDPNWVIDVAGAVLDRLARGNHAFNKLPAEYEIADKACVIIVGDWGPGFHARVESPSTWPKRSRKRSQKIARRM